MVKDGIGGTIKNKLFQKVKSGRIVADNQEDFAFARIQPNSIYCDAIPSKKGHIRRTGWYIYQRHPVVQS